MAVGCPRAARRPRTDCLPITSRLHVPMCLRGGRRRGRPHDLLGQGTTSGCWAPGKTRTMRREPRPRIELGLRPYRGRVLPLHQRGGRWCTTGCAGQARSSSELLLGTHHQGSEGLLCHQPGAAFATGSLYTTAPMGPTGSRGLRLRTSPGASGSPPVRLALPTGLEPAISSLTTRRALHLPRESIGPFVLRGGPVRVSPSASASVEKTGFEPATGCLQSRRLTIRPLPQAAGPSRSGRLGILQTSRMPVVTEVHVPRLAPLPPGGVSRLRCGR